jgi:hypothetical protein
MDGKFGIVCFSERGFVSRSAFSANQAAAGHRPALRFHIRTRPKFKVTFLTRRGEVSLKKSGGFLGGVLI